MKPAIQVLKTKIQLAIPYNGPNRMAYLQIGDSMIQTPRSNSNSKNHSWMDTYMHLTQKPTKCRNRSTLPLLQWLPQNPPNTFWNVTRLH